MRINHYFLSGCRLIMQMVLFRARVYLLKYDNAPRLILSLTFNTPHTCLDLAATTRFGRHMWEGTQGLICIDGWPARRNPMENQFCLLSRYGPANKSIKVWGHGRPRSVKKSRIKCNFHAHGMMSHHWHRRHLVHHKQTVSYVFYFHLFQCCCVVYEM